MLLISGHNGSAALLSKTLSVMTQGAWQRMCSCCSRHSKPCSKFVFLPTAVSSDCCSSTRLPACPCNAISSALPPNAKQRCFSDLHSPSLLVRNADSCAGGGVQCCSAMLRNAGRPSILALTSASALVSSASCRRRHRQGLPLWQTRRMTALSLCCQLLPRLSVSCSHCTCQASPSPGWSSSATGAVWAILASMAIVV